MPSERHAADTTSAAQPLILVMNANGTIEPAMQQYFERGIHTAEGRNAEALIIQLDTPGGDLQSMDNIIQDIRASTRACGGLCRAEQRHGGQCRGFDHHLG